MIFIGISFPLLQSRPISSRPHQSYNPPHRLITVSFISLRSWSRSSSWFQDYQSLTLGSGGRIGKRRYKPPRRTLGTFETKMAARRSLFQKNRGLMRVYSPQYLMYLTSSPNANNTFPKRTVTSKEWALMAHIYVG